MTRFQKQKPVNPNRPQRGFGFRPFNQPNQPTLIG
jgi:hypothetical protein